MNRQQFESSMRQILSFYSRPRNQEEQTDYDKYMGALFESVASMDSFLFDQTTKELLKTLARGQKPMPGQFWAVYHKLSVERAQAAESASSGKESHEDKETCDRRAIEMASRLGKRGAEFCLMILDAAPQKFKYVHPDALQILIDKASEPVSREAAPTVAVGNPVPHKITVNGEDYEVEE